MYSPYYSIKRTNNENTIEKDVIVNAAIEVILQNLIVKLSEKRIEPFLVKKIILTSNYNLKNVLFLSRIIGENKYISKYKSQELSIDMCQENLRLEKDNWMRHQIHEILNCKIQKNESDIEYSVKGTSVNKKTQTPDDRQLIA